MMLEKIALTGRVLGVLLYAPPESKECQPLLATLQEPQWIAEWPYEGGQQAAALLAAGVADNQPETLAEAYQRLFVGPYALAAPPWGSVYLDKESVLFGDSTLRLRQWLRVKGIEAQREHNEPEDHIGTLLMLAAWLAEEQQQALVSELLAQHLLPWAPRYLALLQQHAGHPFYQGLAQLAQATLAAWAADGPAPQVKLELYY
ncbi:twin-argninine leader-binding protein DmsD [Chania multitudinisentens RB-25]|uniref:Tat proofreading chaperone DmsD n=1 Tax=Chania multitudinisentens RB-25 TaxID=1441930 RepID=W0LHZ0_9GAMM|nr:Tat proofreading chaperone DmsD [Chania multitudinisentens]AHG21952.1 twin-argninine leader-binding protein DmsD [Chania multitudinisentens RB-25]